VTEDEGDGDGDGDLCGKREDSAGFSFNAFAISAAPSVFFPICTSSKRLSRSPLNFGGGPRDRQAAITGSS